MANILSFDDRDLQSSGKIKWLKLDNDKAVRISFASYQLDGSGQPILTAHPEVVEENGYFIKGVGYVTETPEIREYVNKPSELRYATVVVQWAVTDDEKPRSINDFTVCVFGFSQKTMQKILFNNKKWSMMKYDITLVKSGTDISLSPEGDNLFHWLRENKPELFAKLWESVRQLKPKVAPTRPMSLEDVQKKLTPNAPQSSTSQSSTQEETFKTVPAPKADPKQASREIENKLSSVTNTDLPF